MRGNFFFKEDLAALLNDRIPPLDSYTYTSRTHKEIFPFLQRLIQSSFINLTSPQIFLFDNNWLFKYIRSIIFQKRAFKSDLIEKQLNYNVLTVLLSNIVYIHFWVSSYVFKLGWPILTDYFYYLCCIKKKSNLNINI